MLNIWYSNPSTYQTSLLIELYDGSWYLACSTCRYTVGFCFQKAEPSKYLVSWGVTVWIKFSYEVHMHYKPSALELACRVPFAFHLLISRKIFFFKLHKVAASETSNCIKIYLWLFKFYTVRIIYVTCELIFSTKTTDT